MEGFEGAGLSERHAAICRFAERATLAPDAMREADLAPLRAAGLDDAAVLTLAHVIGFFNGTNRIADCLHVDPEPG
jgi:uncharacterized peroxidase-related enzyme